MTYCSTLAHSTSRGVVFPASSKGLRRGAQLTIEQERRAAQDAAKGTSTGHGKSNKTQRKGIDFSPFSPQDERGVVGITRKGKEITLALKLEEAVEQFHEVIKVARNGTLIIFTDQIERPLYDKTLSDTLIQDWQSATQEQRNAMATVVYDARCVGMPISGSRGCRCSSSSLGPPPKKGGGKGHRERHGSDRGASGFT